jgi:hypothetical protein
MSGASCSSNIIGKGPFKLPGVKENEVTNFLADKAFKNSDGTDFLNDIDPATTIYTLWIGTNDLGAQGLLTGNNAPGQGPMDYINCIYQSLDEIYKTGGRRFVLMNVIPLNLLPLYTLPKGQGADQFYPNKPADVNELKAAAKKLEEMVLSVNAEMAKRTPELIAKRYPGAQFALYDTHKLVSICTFYKLNPKECH